MTSEGKRVGALYCHIYHAYLILLILWFHKFLNSYEIDAFQYCYFGNQYPRKFLGSRSGLKQCMLNIGEN